MMLDAIPRSVTGMVAGGQAPVPTHLGIAYPLVDLLIVAIVLVQLWSLVRLIRRREPEAVRHPRRRQVVHALPLVWEVGIPYIVIDNSLLPYSAGSRVIPDFCWALLVVCSLWLLTGLVRLVKVSIGVRTPKIDRHASVPQQPAPLRPIST